MTKAAGAWQRHCKAGSCITVYTALLEHLTKKRAGAVLASTTTRDEVVRQVLDETIHAVDSSYSISTTDALAQLNSKVEARNDVGEIVSRLFVLQDHGYRMSGLRGLIVFYESALRMRQSKAAEQWRTRARNCRKTRGADVSPNELPSRTNGLH